MRSLLIISVFILSVMTGKANNIKIDSEARVTGFTGAAQDTALVEFTVSWDNSWRDDFNWDAAWIFLKYKKRGATAEWQHAYLTREGHTATALPGNEGGDYTFMFGEIGSGENARVTGLYLMRDGISEGKVSTRLTLKWPLQSNNRQPLTAADFGTDRDSIYVAAYAVEMVYVPYGSFALGDDFSNQTFRLKKGIIPESADIIDKNSGYVFETNAVASGWPEASAYNLADHINYPDWVESNMGRYTWHNNTTAGPIWFSVDLGENNKKKILYFGISGAIKLEAQRPSGEWYFQGSNDNANWETLWTGLNEVDWPCNTISYPVQHLIKVTNPDYFRYYRVWVSRSLSGSGSILYLSAQNFAMTDKDLLSGRNFYWVDGEEAINMDNSLMADDGQSWSGSLPASYPKGYRGYYCMKYEVSQEQYVEFLNSLTLAQQKNRVANNDFDHMVKGDYAFGDLKRPNCRNGIAFIMTKGAGTPAVFGNNLNPGNKFYSEDDGQTLACNYLSPADMLAYCDWSGLRPMSELEYEKACRRPYPQQPEKGEYAWNMNNEINRLRSVTDLSGGGTEREVPFDYRANVNSGDRVNGPVRSGAFATNRTNQVEAGATYWGLMEMSGNVWEMCYNANAAGRSFVGDNADYSHGDGYLNSDGTTDIGAAYWPNVVGAVAVRGGSFAGVDSLLRTSDRTYATGNYFSTMTQRDSSMGFRGVRSILNSSGFSAGNIFCLNGQKIDTVCHGETFSIQGNFSENPVGKVTYFWYNSTDDGVSWNLIEGESGLTLNNQVLQNSTSVEKVVLFRRKDVCAVGEELSVPVKIICSPVVEKPVLDLTELKAPIGYKFELPCYYKDELECYWELPDQSEKVCGSFKIDNYTAAADGVYKVYFVNDLGCGSERVSVLVTGTNTIEIVNAVDYRLWADGTAAKSAQEYLTPVAPYVYAGATGDGVYRINPDGSGNNFRNVYCDMTTDGGGWMLILNSVSGTLVSTLYTANEYNSLLLGDIQQSFKYADSWINKIAYTQYWTQGWDACGKWNSSYWKKSECTNGGIFATPNTTTSCYIRYDDAEMTTGRHEGTAPYRRCMFDDDRAGDAYFIWPLTNTVYIDWGHSCSIGAQQTQGIYRFWIR